MIVILFFVLFFFYLYILSIKNNVDNIVYKIKTDCIETKINEPYKIALITYDDRFHEYQDYSERINMLYCQKYNIDLIDFSKFGLPELDPKDFSKGEIKNKLQEISPWWRKVFLVHLAMKTNKYDYVIWMDKDACFVNHDLNIHNFLDANSKISFFISNDPNYDNTTIFHIIYYMLLKNDKNYVNSGVFIFKNDYFGNKLLNDWVNGYDKNKWCLADNDSCDLEYKFGNWKTTSNWSDESFEQGYLKYLLDKYEQSNMLDGHVKIFPSNIFANADSENLVFVSHKMVGNAKDANEQRLKFFKQMYYDILNNKKDFLYKKM